MASSCGSFGRGSRMVGRKITFETVVFPNKDVIASSDAFSASWINSMRQGQSLKIVHPNGLECGVCVNLFDRSVQLLSGEVVCRRFGFVAPAHVLLKYKPAFGVFSMKLLNDDMEEEIPVEDADVRPNYNLDGINGWEKNVTSAMVRLHKPQVMHFPKKTCRLVLPFTQKIITMRTGNSVRPCRIKTARRSKFERYITGEWGRFVTQSRLRVGDRLIFLLSNPPDNINVEIVRGRKTVN